MKKWLLGLVLAGILLARPEAAAGAAREALALWYRNVAPSLFPFMALLPLLTCDEALAGYEAALGGLTRRLFRLPGAAASALAVGALAGSPAGCLAAARVSEGMTRGQLERLASACCGLSPAFVVSGIGAGMLGSAGTGWLLLRSQLAAQLFLLLWPDGRDDRPVAPMPADPADDAPLRGAVLGILGVAGFMALFAAVAGALEDIAGPAAGRALLCLTDVTAGARLVGASALGDAARLPLLSALIG